MLVENSNFKNTIVELEDRTIIAGWYGDAVIGLTGIPTFGADDYLADLDSENIVHIMNTYGGNLKDAICEYYYDLDNKNIFRCEMFLANTPLTVVESKIRSKFNVSENLDLLEIADKKGFAAYNFILNLQNMNEEMVYYFK